MSRRRDENKAGRANAYRVDRLLRDGRTPVQVAAALDLSMDYVAYRHQLVAAEIRPLGLDSMPGYDEERDEAFVDLLCARGGLPRIVGTAPNVGLADPWGKPWREVRPEQKGSALSFAGRGLA